MHDIYATALAIYTAMLSKGEPATPALQAWAVNRATDFAATVERIAPSPASTPPKAEEE